MLGSRRISAPTANCKVRLLAVDRVVWGWGYTRNRVKLGSCANQNNEGGWCQMRAVCLMDTRSHEQLDAHIGAMTQGELTLTADL